LSINRRGKLELVGLDGRSQVETLGKMLELVMKNFQMSNLSPVFF
jgi:hypothetical protein